jgi:hypothetical protein
MSRYNISFNPAQRLAQDSAFKLKLFRRPRAAVLGTTGGAPVGGGGGGECVPVFGGVRCYPTVFAISGFNFNANDAAILALDDTAFTEITTTHLLTVPIDISSEGFFEFNFAGYRRLLDNHCPQGEFVREVRFFQGSTFVVGESGRVRFGAVEHILLTDNKTIRTNFAMSLDGVGQYITQGEIWDNWYNPDGSPIDDPDSLYFSVIVIDLTLVPQ